MQFEMLIAMIVPVVIYVVVEIKYGMKPGVIAAIAAGFFLLAYFFVRFDTLENFLLAEVVLLLFLGLITLKLGDSKYFKFQPTVVAVLLATFLFYFQLFDEPVFVRYIPLMAKMNPSMAHIFETDAMRELLARISWHSGILFLAHGAACAWAAVKKSTLFWLGVRLAIYPVMIVFLVVEQLLA